MLGARRTHPLGQRLTVPEPAIEPPELAGMRVRLRMSLGISGRVEGVNRAPKTFPDVVSSLRTGQPSQLGCGVSLDGRTVAEEDDLGL